MSLQCGEQILCGTCESASGVEQFGVCRLLSALGGIETILERGTVDQEDIGIAHEAHLGSYLDPEEYGHTLGLRLEELGVVVVPSRRETGPIQPIEI